MDADWITSPSARRVLQHADDARPAWLWSQDGQTLIWHNAAAELFLAKLKKSGLKRAPMAQPIKGQVARNVRLGSTGRTSLARIQFLAGDKPASTTCATTPLLWQDGQTVLLIVGVDAIASDILEAAQATDEQREAVVEPVEAQPEPEPLDIGAPVSPAFQAGPDAVTVSDADAYERELENWRSTETADVTALADEHELPLAGIPEPAEHMQTTEAEATEPEADAVEEAPRTSRLSLLVDRLAADEALFAPLTDADDTPPSIPGQEPEREPEAEPTSEVEPAEQPNQLFTVRGRGFMAEPVLAEAAVTDVEITEAEADLGDVALLDGAGPPMPDAPAVAEEQPGHATAETAEILPPAPTPDAETVERVSRYNFDELSRILTDRVGETGQPARQPRSTPAPAEPVRMGSLVNLGGETLVLNRLPLGILVFRDQQVLFANRAITEMVGYESVESLRAAGLASVFPAAGPDQEAGPVNHLVQRDGTLVPVTARLQSISWQGRPALMLSASTTEVRTGHEAAVRAFAQSIADAGGDGFFDATRAGVISAITPKTASLLGQTGLEGKPLSGLVAEAAVPALREFLERPARFAETERPTLTVRSANGRAEIVIFAQGQAGVVTGYFGLIRSRSAAPLRLSAPGEPDPALLARISRGVRRPLNTILGFSDLISSQAFGPIENERYESYAQDIAAAGQEIAALVDELDDYARLRDGRYLPERASIELTGLLESCVLRIRQQANNARVIVRNAISERLPRITADRASLTQAVLNLLASAIDQTPTGGAVVISAQHEDDGSIAVHVRDSSTSATDMAERFVVFRDGTGRDGQMMTPVRSSVGLALTRSLLAVNAFSLSVDPAGAQGMLFTLVIPADLVEQASTPGVAE